MSHHQQPKTFTWISYGLAALSGAALTLAFAPFNLYLLAWLIPAMLLWLINGATIKRACALGTCFGVGFGISGLYWFYITLVQFAQTPVMAALILCALIVLVFALFYTVTTTLSACLRTRPKTQAIVFVLLWLLMEVIRGQFFFSGFPWLLLGYSQNHGLLSGFVPVVGVYGMTLLCLCIAVALYATTRTSRTVYRVLAILSVLTLLFIAHVLNQQHFTQWHRDKKISVALLQGNIPQSIKWQPDALSMSISRYQWLSQKVLDHDIVVWPEAALPAFQNQLQDYLQQLDTSAKQHHTAMLIGMPTLKNNPQRFYNSAITLGNAQGSYNKQHLVPFGETMPVPWITHPILRYLHIPMSSFDRGDQHQAPVILNGVRSAVFICYEIIFPHLLVKQARHSQLLITINDDSWYGDSIALDQHLQMASFAAKATGRFLLFDSNSGITAIIGPSGRVLQQAPINTVTTVKGSIIPISGNTPYMRFWPF